MVYKGLSFELGKLYFFVCDYDFEKLIYIYFQLGFYMVLFYVFRKIFSLLVIYCVFKLCDIVFYCVVKWWLLVFRFLRRENYIDIFIFYFIWSWIVFFYYCVYQIMQDGDIMLFSGI